MKKKKKSKHDFSDKNTKNFQFLSENIKWDRSLPSNTDNKANNNFLKMLSDLHDIAISKAKLNLEVNIYILQGSLKV